MSRFLSPTHGSLVPYVPGEQPQVKKYIKLNTNESPFEPSPEVVKAINSDEVNKLNLYSDPEAKQLISAIAGNYGINTDRVLVGNGSDEVLAFAFHAFCDENKGIAFPDVTYGFYPVFADFFGIKYKLVPLNSRLEIDIDDYREINDNVIIANPNAQTGTYLTPDKIEQLIAQNTDRLVIIDEAYIDFGGQSAVPLTDKYDNLLVIQTFSKSRNLAGARVGFAIGSPALIADLNMMKFSFNPYNLNRLSIVAGAASMADKAYMQKCVSSIISTRERTKAELSSLGFTFPDSMANFILAQSDRISGKELYSRLHDAGIIVRYLGGERISNYNRITIGSDEQMDTLISQIKTILGENL